MSDKQQILGIHKSGQKMVLAITGGGTQCIGDLLKYGGGSNTVIEAIVPYSQNSFNEFVGGIPDKYCSKEAAADLAFAAFQRARKLSGQDNVVGVGVTCSLMKDGEREGREHHAYIGLQNQNETYVTEIMLQGINREQQERCVSDNTINFIESAGQILEQEDNKYKELIIGQRSVIQAINNTGRIGQSRRVIFAGAFNPLHEQHIAIADAVYKLTSVPIDFEICVKNVDKIPLNYIEIQKRVCQFKNIQKDWMGDVFLTTLPTFAEKCQEFQSSLFIVGWDTYKRLDDPKYGSLLDAAIEYRDNDVRFLLIDRPDEFGASHLGEMQYISGNLRAITRVVDIPLSDISSSKIRGVNVR